MPVGAPGNWSYGGAPPAGGMVDNRPKSANMTGSAGNQGAMPTSARPVSGNGMVFGPSPGPAGGSWQQQGGVAVNPSGMANNNNTLSYGSLKNRLLPGSSAPAAAAPVANGMPAGAVKPQSNSVQGSSTGGAVAPTNGSGATGTSKSKLFSLAR